MESQFIFWANWTASWTRGTNKWLELFKSPRGLGLILFAALCEACIHPPSGLGKLGTHFKPLTVCCLLCQFWIRQIFQFGSLPGSQKKNAIPRSADRHVIGNQACAVLAEAWIFHMWTPDHTRAPQGEIDTSRQLICTYNTCHYHNMLSDKCDFEGRIQ